MCVKWQQRCSSSDSSGSCCCSKAVGGGELRHNVAGKGAATGLRLLPGRSLPPPGCCLLLPPPLSDEPLTQGVFPGTETQLSPETHHFFSSLPLFLFCFLRWICTICPRIYIHTHIYIFFVRSWMERLLGATRCGEPSRKPNRSAASWRCVPAKRSRSPGAPEQTLRTERFGLGGEDEYRRMTSYPVQM